MDAKELFTKDGKSAGVYYCSECRRVCRTEQEAGDCCVCVECKEGLREKYSTLCLSCKKRSNDEKQEKLEAQEREALAIAVETTEWEYVWHNDHMYSDLDELAEDREYTPPEYVFAMKPVHFQGFDLEEIIDRFNENNAECLDDFDVRDRVSGIEILKAAVDDFNKRNETVILYWEEDRTQKVKVLQ